VIVHLPFVWIVPLADEGRLAGPELERTLDKATRLFRRQL